MKSMKKILCMLLAGVMLISAAGCGVNKEAADQE